MPTIVGKKDSILAGDPTAEGTPRPTRVLGIAEVEELLTQFPPNLKPYITFLYFCGGRSGEAELIEWSQVDLERKLVRIEDDQTNDKEEREIPLPQRLVLMLERIEPKQGRVFDTTNIRKQWRQACAAVGLGRIIQVEGRPYDPRYEGLTLHDFRRSAIRNLATLAGVREKLAMEITRPQDTQCVRPLSHHGHPGCVARDAAVRGGCQAKSLVPNARVKVR